MIYHTVHERIPVSIKELDVTCDEWTKHLNTETGEIVDIPDDPIAADMDEEDIPDISDKKFVQLPSQWDLHEYQIMKEFAEKLKDAKAQQKIFSALSRPHPYRRSKDEVARDDYFAFCMEAFKAIAERWRRYHEIPYMDWTTFSRMSGRRAYRP